MNTFAVAGLTLIVTPLYIAFGCAVGTLLRDHGSVHAGMHANSGAFFENYWTDSSGRE